MPDELNADFDDIEIPETGMPQDKSPEKLDAAELAGTGGDLKEGGFSPRTAESTLDLNADFDDIPVPSKYERIDPAEDPIGWLKSIKIKEENLKKSGVTALGSVISLLDPLPGVRKDTPYSDEKLRVFPAIGDFGALLSEILYVGPREAVGEGLDELGDVGDALGIMTGMRTDRDEHGKIDIGASIWDKVLAYPSTQSHKDAGRSTAYSNTPLADAFFSGLARRFDFTNKEVRRGWEQIIEEEPIELATDLLTLAWGGSATIFAGLKVVRKLDKLTGRSRQTEKFLHESMNLKLGKHIYDTKAGLFDFLDPGMLPVLGMGKSTSMLFDRMLRGRGGSIEGMAANKRKLYYETPEAKVLEGTPVGIKDPEGGGGPGGSGADEAAEYDRIIREHDEAQGGDTFADVDAQKAESADAGKAEADAAASAQEGWVNYDEIPEEFFEGNVVDPETGVRDPLVSDPQRPELAPDFSQGVRGSFKRIVVDPPGEMDLSRAGGQKAYDETFSSVNVSYYDELLNMMNEMMGPPNQHQLGGNKAASIESWFTEEGWSQYGQAIFEKAEELGLNPQLLESDAIGPVYHLDRHQVLKDTTNVNVPKNLTPNQALRRESELLRSAKMRVETLEAEARDREKSWVSDAEDAETAKFREDHLKQQEIWREEARVDLEEVQIRYDEAKAKVDESRGDVEGAGLAQEMLADDVNKLETETDAVAKEFNRLYDELAFDADPRKFVEKATEAFGRYSQRHFEIFDGAMNRVFNNLKTSGKWSDEMTVDGSNVRRFLRTIDVERVIPIWEVLGKPAQGFRDMPFEFTVSARYKLVQYILENRRNPVGDEYGISLSEALAGLPEDASSIVRDKMTERLLQERSLWVNSNKLDVYEGLLEAMNMDVIDAARKAEVDEIPMGPGETFAGATPLTETLEGAQAMHSVVEAKMKAQWGQFLQTELGGAAIDDISRYYRVKDKLFTAELTKGDLDDIVDLIGGPNSEATQRLQGVFGQELIEHLARVNSGRSSSGFMADLVGNPEKADLFQALLPKQIQDGFEHVDDLLERVRRASESKDGGPVTVDELSPGGERYVDDPGNPENLIDTETGEVVSRDEVEADGALEGSESWTPDSAKVKFRSRPRKEEAGLASQDRRYQQRWVNLDTGDFVDSAEVGASSASDNAMRYREVVFDSQEGKIVSPESVESVRDMANQLNQGVRERALEAGERVGTSESPANRERRASMDDDPLRSENVQDQLEGRSEDVESVTPEELEVLREADSSEVESGRGPDYGDPEDLAGGRASPSRRPVGRSPGGENRQNRREVLEVLRYFGPSTLAGGMSWYQTQNLMVGAATFGAIMGAPHIYRKYIGLMDNTAAGKGLMVDYVMEVMNHANQRKVRSVLRGGRESEQSKVRGGPLRMSPRMRGLQRGGLQVQY